MFIRMNSDFTDRALAYQLQYPATWKLKFKKELRTSNLEGNDIHFLFSLFLFQRKVYNKATLYQNQFATFRELQIAMDNYFYQFLKKRVSFASLTLHTGYDDPRRFLDIVLFGGSTPQGLQRYMALCQLTDFSRLNHALGNLPTPERKEDPLKSGNNCLSQAYKIQKLRQVSPIR